MIQFSEDHFKTNYALTNLLLNDNLASSSVSFSPQTFNSLISLEYLDLSNTYCRSIPSDAFENLANLTTLLMQSSYVKEMPWFSRKMHMRSMKLPKQNKRSAETPALLSPVAGPTSAWYNPKLQYLDVSSNAISLESLPNKCLPPSLRHLDMSYTRGQSITNDTFSNLSKLKKLELLHSNIKNLAEGAFDGMKKLSYVSISFNPFNDEPVFPIATTEINMTHHHVRGLTSARLGRLINLNSIDFSNGEITTVEPRVFEHMASLKSLNLTRNVLSRIGNETFVIK